MKQEETSTKEGRGLFQLNRDEWIKNARHFKRWIYKIWWLAIWNKRWVLCFKKGHALPELGRETNWFEGGKGIPVLVDWICGARLKWLLVAEIEDGAWDKGLKFCKIEMIDIIEVARVGKWNKRITTFYKTEVLEGLRGMRSIIIYRPDINETCRNHLFSTISKILF